MGWTGSHVDPCRGKIDRKHECDLASIGETNSDRWEVLKSTMRGATYYAAVKHTNKLTGEFNVFAVVLLTRVDNSDYYNFYYKDMDESMHPFYYDCPDSILELLTETESEAAREWREICRKRNKDGNRLGKLPIGTVIQFEMNGQTYKAVKTAPAYQFKTPFWMGANGYFKKKDIPRDFIVV